MQFNINKIISITFIKKIISQNLRQDSQKVKVFKLREKKILNFLLLSFKEQVYLV
jgi:hypothetical protein